MSLKDRTYGEIEKALKAAGAFNPNAAGINLQERWTVSNNKVIFTADLMGMGHNEPDSYGIRTTTYTEKELFPDDDS